MCSNPRNYTFNNVFGTYYDDCKAVSRFALNASDPAVGVGRVPMYISARRTVVNGTRFGVNFQGLISIAQGSNTGPNRGLEWSMGQQQFGMCVDTVLLEGFHHGNPSTHRSPLPHLCSC